MEPVILLTVVAACTVAAVVWGRSARARYRISVRVLRAFGAGDAAELSRGTFVKDATVTLTFGVLALSALLALLVGSSVPFLLVALPVAASVAIGRRFGRHARLSESRWVLERKAEETLSQEDLAPKRWAERLAPTELPTIAGFELGQVYQAGTGVLAGDFYDVVELDHGRVAVLVGDVSGHGIEASITAFQAKYLLRVFLQQYRDPAQAVEQLNAQMASIGRMDEFISLCVVVFDTVAGTLRYTSAGHPVAWFWHDRDLRPLRATGPLVMLDPKAGYYSRELTVDDHDLVVLYTDGLAEARAGTELFGEDRIAAAIRRDPGASTDVLCKDLLEAAKDFATSAISDDVAVVAIRRV